MTATTHPRDNLRLVQFHGESFDDPGDVFQAAADYLRANPDLCVIAVGMVYREPLYVLQVTLGIDPDEDQP